MEKKYISKQENSIIFQMVRAAVKKRKAGIKEGANRAFYFSGYLGKFCKRGDFGKQNSYQTERIMWEAFTWQREWPVQWPQGKYLFQKFKAKSKASAASAMTLMETDDRRCHTCEERNGLSATTVISRHRAVLARATSPSVYIMVSRHPMS